MINKVILMGRLTADPELRQTTTGISSCNFTVAVDRGYKSANGEKQTDFIRCQAWKQTAEFVSRYFSKGKMIIGFQYDAAYPFNKYGVAVVYDIETGWKLIDQAGQEVQGTRFDYLSKYYNYNDRFLEFSYEERIGEEPVGIYDTKERKILMEPSVSMITELSEDCILIYVRKGEIMVVKTD